MDGLIYNSRLTKTYTESYYPSVTCKENQIVYYGVDTDFFQPTTDVRDDYFLLVGGLAPRKGIYNIMSLAEGATTKSRARKGCEAHYQKTVGIMKFFTSICE